MIILNEFPEFEKEVLEIDKELFYVNMKIKKTPKGTAPQTDNEHIFIPSDVTKDMFCSELVHEGGHLVFDPITTYDYITCVYEIKKKLGINENAAFFLANAASDCLNDYQISKNKKLREFRKKGLIEAFKQGKLAKHEIAKILLEHHNIVHEMNLTIDNGKYKDVAREIIEIDKSNKDRAQKYVDIASILIHYLPEIPENDINNAPTQAPIKPNKEEIKKIVKKIFKDSNDCFEAKEKLRILLKLCGKGYGGIPEIPHDEMEILKEFFESQANKVRSFIEYPKVKTMQGIKLGVRKWRFRDGYLRMNIEKTISKNGINIPLVTTKTDNIIKFKIGTRESKKPIDIVISIDVSGSTGEPNGYMNEVADYEVIMLYALINEAIRLNQKVGLTLWSNDITYTTLPKCLDWRELEKLKEVPFKGYWLGGGTNLKKALKQAKKYKDKLFLVFTDGAVDYLHLIDVNNVVFFLIKPEKHHYDWFVKKYGEHRVIEITDITKIPKVTLEWFRKTFAR